MTVTRWYRLSALVGSLAVTGAWALAGPVPTALAAPAPASAVQVHGAGTTPLAVTISWTAPADSSYAGARVVVVTGSVATADPADSGAVYRTDVAAPGSTVTVNSLTGGQTYAATVFAYDSASSYSTGTSVTWTEPGAVSPVVEGTDRGGGLILFAFAAPVGADAVVVCTVDGGPPPAEPAGPAACSAPITYQPKGWNAAVPAAVGHTYGVSVFSYSSRLRAYGPPASVASVAVLDVAPSTPALNVWSVTAHTVTIGFSNDPDYLMPLLTDLKELVVTRASGVRAPAATARPVAVIPLSPAQAEGSYKATGLVTNQAYTFSLRLRDLAGHLSTPATFTVAAHVAGTFLADTAAGGWRRTRAPAPSQYGAVRFGVTGSGVVHLVYTDWNTNRIYYSWKAPGQRWSQVQPLGTTGQYAGAPTIDVSPAGHILVGWEGPNGPVFRARWAGHPWGPTRAIPSKPGTVPSLISLVQDTRLRVHAVIDEVTYAPDGVHFTAATLYVTNVTGKWTRSQLLAQESPAAWSVERLAADPANGSIVVLIAEQGVLRLARKPRTATSFGTQRTILRGELATEVAPYSVATYSGRITIAVQTAGSRAGVTVMTGTSPARMSTRLRLPGARSSDASPQLAMKSARRIAVAWIRTSATWTPSQQGVFTSGLTYSTTTGSWIFAKPQQCSNTHYDDAVLGLHTDRHGNLYVGFSRTT